MLSEINYGKFLKRKPRQHIKKQQRHHFANKGPYKVTVFSSSYIRMWDLDHKEGWVLKDWCFRTVVLEETLESSLDGKEIKPVNPRVKQPCLLIRRTDAEAQIPWPPDMKSQLTGKDPNAGKGWGQEETGVTEDKKIVCHHWLNEHEFEQTPRDSDGSLSIFPWRAAVHEVAKRRTRFSDWTIKVK